MKLVLMRHATRSTQGYGDTQLNTVGRAQAEDLVLNLAPKGTFPEPTRILCSPKTRAKETVAPLAATLRLTPEIDARLDERHQYEAISDFELRIRELFDEATDVARAELRENQNVALPSRPETCWVHCSHLDWLESALLILPTDMTEFESSQGFVTAEYRVFRFEDGIWKLKATHAIPARHASR